MTFGDCINFEFAAPEDMPAAFEAEACGYSLLTSKLFVAV